MTRLIVPLVLGALLVSSPLVAQDIREAARQAAEDKAVALEEARQAEAHILADREALRRQVAELESTARQFEAQVAALESRIRTLESQRKELGARWAEKELGFREISGNIRVTARDLEALLRDSPTWIGDRESLDRLAGLLEEGYFPDIEDVSFMASLALTEVERSGEVALYPEMPFVGRDGETRAATVLRVGTSTLAYRSGGETGFLQYLPESRRYAALPALPSRWVRTRINRYLKGDSDEVPVDLSGGTALRQITQSRSLIEQLQAGGPIVIPLGVLALLALAIILERTIHLGRIRADSRRILSRLEDAARSGRWDGSETVVRDSGGDGSPVGRVLEAGLAARNEGRQNLESILHEAILSEVPRLERFLPLLAVVGTIAPLLGLLGTVTGMIRTFHVITLHGTGNPRLMSGGISEALVTTEIGLAIAIPVMLVHVMLSRRVNRIVGDMEESAVALTNIIEKDKTRAGTAAGSR